MYQNAIYNKVPINTMGSLTASMVCFSSTAAIHLRQLGVEVTPQPPAWSTMFEKTRQVSDGTTKTDDVEHEFLFQREDFQIFMLNFGKVSSLFGVGNPGVNMLI